MNTLTLKEFPIKLGDVLYSVSYNNEFKILEQTHIVTKITKSNFMFIIAITNYSCCLTIIPNGKSFNIISDKTTIFNTNFFIDINKKNKLLDKLYTKQMAKLVGIEI